MYSWRREFPHFPLTPVVPGMPVLTTGTNTLGQHVSLDPDHTIFLKKSSLSVIPNILSPPCLETFEFYDSPSFHGLSESPSPGQALMTHYWWNVFDCSGLVPKSHRKSKFVPLRCSVWNTRSSKFDLVGNILNVQISQEMTDLAMLSPCALKSAMAEAWCLLST